MSGGELLVIPTIRLLRVVKESFLAAGVPRVPTAATFEPSTADKAHHPVRVSVWDADHIMLRRACEIRVALVPLVGLVLTVGDVYIVASDPLVASGMLLPVTDPEGAIGAEPNEVGWHYGIQGLAREDFPNRIAWKRALTLLAGRCHLAA